MFRISSLAIVALVLLGTAPNKLDKRDRRTRVRTTVAPPAASTGYTSPYIWEFASPSGTAVASECTCPATLATDTGQAITFSRASSATCVTSAGTGVTCATDQPVIEKRGSWYGVRSEDAVTNLFLRSDELDNSGAWTLNGTPTITANAMQGPFAGMEKIEDTNAAGWQGIYQTVTTGIATGYHYASCWMASGTQTKVTIWTTRTGGSPAQICNFNLTPTPTRYTCVGPNYGTVTNVQVGIYPGIADTNTGYIYVGSCQLERNANINSLGGYDGTSSYIATTSAQVSRAATSLSFTAPATITDAAGCINTAQYWDSNNQNGGTDWINDQIGTQTLDNVLQMSTVIARKLQFYDGTNAPQTAAVAASLKDAWNQSRAGWTTSGGNSSEVQGQNGSNSPVSNMAGAYDGTVDIASKTVRLGSNYAQTRHCNCLVGPTALSNSKTSCTLRTP